MNKSQIQSPLEKTKSLKILIGEDNDDVTKLYQRVLRNKGHRPHICTNGKECVEIYLSELEKIGNEGMPFDLVLLDYAMPEKNGIEVAQEILNQVPEQNLVFATAYGDKLITEMQSINLNTGIYPKFSTLESFINFVESNAN